MPHEILHSPLKKEKRGVGGGGDEQVKPTSEDHRFKHSITNCLCIYSNPEKSSIK